MTDGTSHIQVGDYIVPDEDIDVGDGVVVPADQAWGPPAKVLNVYKNGNLRARTDDGRCEWTGKASAFRRVQSGGDVQ